jgi:hypothetical protein
MNLMRVCADCEFEAGAMDRGDAFKSHGLCQRHFVGLLTEAGLSSEKISEAVAEMGPEAFCPDLGERPTFNVQLPTFKA